MQHENLKNIKAFAFDVDGVFTDGGVFCDVEGQLLRTFDAKDGFGVRMAIMNGYKVAIITGGNSASIRHRFKGSRIPPEDIYLGSRDKYSDLVRFCEKYDLQPSEVLYIGDDIPDIEVIMAVGIGLCPSDAATEVKAAADVVSDFPGGKGCVRDAVESVLKAQGKWEFDKYLYKRLY